MIPSAESSSGAEVVRSVLIAFAPLFGATVGSFLNVCIYRLPREGLSPARPRRSFCPSCGTPIAWQDNIPLVSWVALRGACRQCRAPISFRYFVVESLTAGLFLAVAYRWLVSGEASLGAALATGTLVSAVVVAAFIDLDLRIIPDSITLRGIALVPVVAVLVPDLQGSKPDAAISAALAEAVRVLQPFSSGLPAGVRGLPALAAVPVGCALGAYVAVLRLQTLLSRRGKFRERPEWYARYLWPWLAGCSAGVLALGSLRPEWFLSPRILSFWAALWGMTVGGALVFGVGVVGSWLFRKPAMGLGDVKLMALLGGFTGWVGVVKGFFLACLLGAVVGLPILIWRRARARSGPCYIPFGPFLALGCFLILLWPAAFERALGWYLSLFQL